jgi:uncharacterized protein YbjT (DUF2867 family)
MTAFVAIIAIALVMVAGMAYDGGGIISAQGQTRSNAAKAARAGAQEVDITSLRSTGKTVLDPARAKQSALAYLAQAGAAGTVTVTVTMNQPMHILPVPDRTVVATETATALHGKSP